MTTKFQAGCILILSAVTAGIVMTAVPMSAAENTTEEPNQKRSVADTIKTYIFSLGNTLYNRFGRGSDYENKNTTTIEVFPYDNNENSPTTTQYNKQGEVNKQVKATANDSMSSPQSFWSKILTTVTNTYNNLGRIFGFSSTENKQKKEEETGKYNEKGTADSFMESSNPETTATPTNNIDYNAAGKIIQKTTVEVGNSPTPTPRQRPQQKRTQIATPTPAPSSSQRR